MSKGVIKTYDALKFDPNIEKPLRLQILFYELDKITVLSLLSPLIPTPRRQSVR